jgi:hypothetical protein
MVAARGFALSEAWGLLVDRPKSGSKGCLRRSGSRTPNKAGHDALPIGID